MLKARRSDRPPAPKKVINKNNNTIKDFYNSKFGAIKKYIIYIFISLIIILIGFIILAPMLVNLKVWKPEIKAMLEAETGKIAEIQGDIELSIYPSPQIKIYRISLKDDNDGVLSNFFNSDSIVAKLSLWPLIKGNIVIDKIIFEDLTVNLINYPNKDPNWVFYKKQNKLELDTNEFNEVHKKFNHLKYPNIQVNEYAINKGNIIYNKDNKINLKNILITKNNNTKVIKGNVGIDGLNFSLNSSFTQKKPLEKVWKSSLSLINKNIKILTKGDVKFNNNYPALEGTLEINSDELRKLSKDYKYLNLLKNKFKLLSEISLSYQNNNLLYSVYNLSINSAPFNFTGTVSGNNGKKPKINLILSSNNINLDEFSKSVRNIRGLISNDNNQSLKTKNSFWDLYEGTMLLSIGTAKFLEYPIRDLVIDIKREEKNYILNIGKGIFPGNTKISFKGNLNNDFSVFKGSSEINSDNLRQFSKWLSIDIKNISDSRLRKTKLSSNVVIRDGGASFIGINGNIDSSKVTGEVRLRYTDLNTLYASLKIDKINLDAYLENNKEAEHKSKNNSLDIVTFDEVNIDINFAKALISKSEYNNIKLLGIYKNNVLKVEKLSISNFAKGDLNLTGNIDYSSKSAIYDLAINFNHNDFEQFYNFYNLPKYFHNLFAGKGKIEATVKGNLNSLLSNLKLNTDRLNVIYGGSLNLKNFSLVGYDGKINFKINDLNKFLLLSSKKNIIEEANLISDVFMKNNELTIKNIDFESSTYKYNGDIYINYLNNDISLDIDLISKVSSISDVTNIYNYFILNPNSSIKGQIKLKADLFNIDNLKIYNFDSFVNINEEGFDLKKFEGDFLDGTISANIKKVNINENEYNGIVKFSNINANRFITNYFAYDKIEGDIDSKVKIYGKAKNMEQFFRTLNAEGEIFINNPKINGLDINKLIETKDFKDVKSINKLVIQSFNTDKQAKINNFSIKYKINDNLIILDETALEVDKLNSRLKGKFNFFNLNYNASLKINIDGNDNKSIFIKFVNKEGVKNIDIENNYISNKESSGEDVGQKAPQIKKISTSNIDDFLDEVFKKSVIGDFDNKILIEDEKTNEVQKSIVEILEPKVNFIKLPEYLKGIKSPVYRGYSKPKIIKNSTIKPKMPTQEDLLDNLLENILNP